jgi:hypothetical protein
VLHCLGCLLNSASFFACSVGRLGDYKKQADLCQKALKMTEKTHGADSQQAAEVISELGVFALCECRCRTEQRLALVLLVAGEAYLHLGEHRKQIEVMTR